MLIVSRVSQSCIPKANVWWDVVRQVVLTLKCAKQPGALGSHPGSSDYKETRGDKVVIAPPASTTGNGMVANKKPVLRIAFSTTSTA